MMPFTAITRLNTPEYTRLMIRGLYRKPLWILISLLGLVLIGVGLVALPGNAASDSFWPVLNLVYGVLLLAAPLLVAWLSVRRFRANPSFQNDLVYSFEPHGFSVEGLTFKSEYQWEHIRKARLLGPYLVLYHTAQAGNLVDTRTLTPEQIAFIQSKVRGT